MTYATLPVSRATFDEVKRKLEAAGYPVWADKVPVNGISLVLDSHDGIVEKAEAVGAVDPLAALRAAVRDIPAELMAGIMYDRLCVFMPNNTKRDVLWCATNLAFDLQGKPG